MVETTITAEFLTSPAAGTEFERHGFLAGRPENEMKGNGK
jgi:hypothetical protein